jgi:cellulose synthase/poly-beta-1,6-N-acetylglucosamine synthase-like glycosyltransferase
MDIFLFILFILLLFYLVINFAINRTFSDRASAVKLSSNNLFSIVIAAKNEEHNLDDLIETLENLQYPREQYEVIFVDDHSSDNTYQKLQDFTQKNEIWHVYRNPSQNTGKKGALEYGIGKAKYDNIIITDADCILPKELLKFYSNAFNKKYQFVFGLAPFIQKKNFVNQLACYENLRSQLLMFSAARLGLPYSATARNFGFRRSAFDKLGGYSKTMETISGDDDLLLREAVKKRMRIGTVVHQDAAVFSKAKDNWYEYIKQKSRHTSTSLHYLLRHKVFLGIWHLSNILFLLSIVFTLFNQIFILPFMVKFIIDAFIVQQHQRWLGYKFNLFTIILFQTIYEFLIVLNFINTLKKKSDWH